MNKYNIPDSNSFTVCFDKQNNLHLFVINNNSEKQKSFKNNKNKLQYQEPFRIN
jgi:hypothetical protein